MNENEIIFEWEDITEKDEKILWQGEPFVKTGILAGKGVTVLLGIFLIAFFAGYCACLRYFFIIFFRKFMFFIVKAFHFFRLRSDN